MLRIGRYAVAFVAGAITAVAAIGACGAIVAHSPAQPKKRYSVIIDVPQANTRTTPAGSAP